MEALFVTLDTLGRTTGGTLWQAVHTVVAACARAVAACVNVVSQGVAACVNVVSRGFGRVQTGYRLVFDFCLRWLSTLRVLPFFVLILLDCHAYTWLGCWFVTTGFYTSVLLCITTELPFLSVVLSAILAVHFMVFPPL